MKTIDTKSLLLGVLSTALLLTLTSSKSVESNDFDFFTTTIGVGIYNKTTKTMYIYKQNGPTSLKDKPSNIFQLTDDGSSLTEKQ